MFFFKDLELLEHVIKHFKTPFNLQFIFLFSHPNSTDFKNWKQPKCPLVNEWIKKLAHLHNGILCSRKKEGAPTLCDSMDGT